MATDLSVIMTHLPGDEHRDRSYRHVKDWYGWPDSYVHVDLGGGGRAAAINRAVRATSGDIVVLVDTDSLVPRAALGVAVEMAAADAGLVVPHTRYLYLTGQATDAVLGGADPAIFGPDDCEFSGYNGVGNVVVFSRATWVAAHGYDERMRFGDDAAFAYACAAFTGNATRPVPGDVVHLWHPRPEMSIPGTEEYEREFARVAEYRDAAQIGPEAVRRLVESR